MADDLTSNLSFFSNISYYKDVIQGYFVSVYEDFFNSFDFFGFVYSYNENFFNFFS